MNTRNIFLIFFALMSCGGQPTKTNDPVVYAESNDPELEQAKKDALNNLDYFIKSFNEHSNDTIFQYSIKADFIDYGQHEHMWVSLNKIDKEQFKGYLGNDPQIVKNIKYGDLITITKSQIEDWIIFDSKTNNMEGGYSVKVLQKREQK
jgi:uncharacterized protein YegJ (DUF2314 family)